VCQTTQPRTIDTAVKHVGSTDSDEYSNIVLCSYIDESVD